MTSDELQAKAVEEKAELARDGVEGPRAAPKGDARVPRGAAHAGSAMGRHACHTAVRGATLNSMSVPYVRKRVYGNRTDSNQERPTSRFAAV